MGLLKQTPHPRRTGNPTDWLFEGERDKEEAEVNELRERLQNLKVVSRAKVTENRVYSAVYHPEKTKDIVFFGGEYLASPKLHAMCGESIDVVAM